MHLFISIARGSALILEKIRVLGAEKWDKILFHWQKEITEKLYSVLLYYSRNTVCFYNFCVQTRVYCENITRLHDIITNIR